MLIWPEHIDEQGMGPRRAPLTWCLVLLCCLSWLGERMLLRLPSQWALQLGDWYAQARLYTVAELQQPWQLWSSQIVLDGPLQLLLNLLIWPLAGAAVERRLGFFGLWFILVLFAPMAAWFLREQLTTLVQLPVQTVLAVLVALVVGLDPQARIRCACVYWRFSVVVLRRFPVPLPLLLGILLAAECLRFGAAQDDWSTAVHATGLLLICAATAFLFGAGLRLLPQR
ncbi:MAG: hypothetical protein ACOCXA_01740 [Planctomycetota bacterium]